MITDVWQGLAVYRSADALSWTRQDGPNLLAKPGLGEDDGVKGGHPDIVVSGERVFLFYFTHPGRTEAAGKADGYEQRRSSIHLRPSRAPALIAGPRLSPYCGVPPRFR